MADSIPPLAPTPYDGAQLLFLEAALMTVIRHNGIRLDDLRTLFDRSFTALGTAVGAGLVTPVGPAFAIYHGDPAGVFDVEIGFPTAGAPTRDIETPAGAIHASALPAGNAMVTSHLGSYDGLGDAWRRLVAAADGQPKGVFIEAYVSDPSTTATDQLRTDLILPVRSA